MDNKHLNGYINDEQYEEEKQYYPCCVFCGTQTLPLACYDSQESANESAALKCSCDDAKKYQAEKRKQEEREKNIKNLQRQVDNISLYCAVYNIELSDEFKKIIFDAGISVIDNLALSAKFKLAGLSVSITSSKDNVVVIKTVYSDKALFEV